MSRQFTHIAVGASFVAGCLLMQGCRSSKDQQAEQEPVPVPTEEVKQAEPVPEPELKPVAATTAYTIQKGDTLTGVAYKYSLRWQDVVAVNPGVSPKKLRVGQVIQLPGQVDLARARAVQSAPKTTAPKATGAEAMYVVKSGDSISLIAHKHGVKADTIRSANGLKSDTIVVGQKLRIVGAKKVAGTAESKKKTAAAPKTNAPKAAAVAPTADPAAKPVVETAPIAVPPPPAAPAEGTPAAPVVAPATPDAAAPAAANPAAASATSQTYTVKEGEDLYAVAIRWGVSPGDLKALNNLTSTELKAGTVLKIPGGAQ